MTDAQVVAIMAAFIYAYGVAREPGHVAAIAWQLYNTVRESEPGFEPGERR